MMNTNIDWGKTIRKIGARIGTGISDIFSYWGGEEIIGFILIAGTVGLIIFVVITAINGEKEINRIKASQPSEQYMAEVDAKANEMRAKRLAELDIIKIKEAGGIHKCSICGKEHGGWKWFGWFRK